MNMNLSQLVMTTFTGGLGTLLTVLDRAEKFGGEQGVDASDLIATRLYADMFDLSQQVQAATDTARRVTERLVGAKPTSKPDPDHTWSALRARVTETLEAVRSADTERIDARADESFTVNLGQEMTFTGRSYTLTFAVPNFLFHVATAYGLMRHRGVKLGKIEYIRPFMG